jgi:hypothetical protein
MNLKEIKENINYIMDNNIHLESKDVKPYTVCLEGGHGIGKTAIVEEIAKERGIKFTKINLGAFEEVGDLTGFPIKKYEMINKNGEKVRVAEASLEAHMTAGYQLVPGSDPVMDFAIPSWVPTAADGANILLLDDYSRANPLILQSTMELLDKGQLGTWKLPKNTQIILTSNPDNGEYSVSSMDNAQKTRFITFEVDFDVKLLATHMEEVGVRSEFINFALLYPEMFEPNQNNNQATGRTYMAFARTLESVTNLGTPDGLSRALDISGGIFDAKDNILGINFTLFINNKLDKLITPDDLVNKPWADVAKELEASMGCVDDAHYRADIAATITFRLVNHIMIQFDKPGTASAPYVDRILKIVNHNKTMLAMDLVYAMANKLFTNHASRVSKLLVDPKFKDMLLS